jgi:hypothetical protein
MNAKIYPFFFTVLFILILQNTLHAQAPSWLWADGFGGTLNDRGNAVVTDGLGNSYSTGSFQVAVDFDPGIGFHSIISNGDLDVFISKLDPQGNFLWAKRIGGSNTDEGMAIACDQSGNIYVTGHFQGIVDLDPGPDTADFTSSGNYDIFLIKLNSVGQLIWARQMGGGSIDDPAAIALDANANIYLTGYFSNSADFNPDPVQTFTLTSAGGQDIFISKIDSSGNFIWAGNMGGTSSERGLSVATDISGNVFATGYFSNTADFDPGNNVFNLTSNGSTDIFIVKLDNAGNFVWADGIGRTSGDRGLSITVDAAGNVYTTGYFSGTVDFDPSGSTSYTMTSTGVNDGFIYKLSNGNTFLWAKAFAASVGAIASGNCIISDPVNGNVYVSGGFNSSVNLDPGVSGFTLIVNGIDDIFYAGYDSSGSFSWALSVGGSNSDASGTIYQSAAGNIYVSGTFHSSSIAFGTTTLNNTVSTGFPEIFIAKLDNLPTSTESVLNHYNTIVYPNPVTNSVSIVLKDNIRFADVHITDVSGKIIYQNENLSTGEIKINTENFACGIYLLHIKSNENLETRKMMVVK